MVKRGKFKFKDVLVSVGIILAASLLTSLITMFITEIRSLPQPVLLELPEGSSCPQELNFENNATTISFNIKNIGSPGFLSATLNIAGNEWKREKLLDNKDEHSFSYQISNKTVFSDLLLSLEYSCYKNVFGMSFNCKPQTYCCSFSEKYENSYKLVSSEC